MQQLPDQIKSHHGNKHDEAENKHHAGDGGVAPWREYLVLRLGGQNHEGIATALLVEAQALQPVQVRLEIAHAGKCVGANSLEEGPIRQVASDVTVVGAARQGEPVGAEQRDSAARADVELAIEFREIRGADGRNHDASKAAIAMIESPRDGHDPFAIQAPDRVSDECAWIGRLQMVAEEFTIAEAFSAGTRRRQPVAVLVNDGEPADTFRCRLARNENVLKLRKRRRCGSVRLKAADGAEYAGIHQVETVLRVLDQRTRQVGQIHLRGPQSGCARVPFAQAAHAENGDANQRDKCRHQERQARQADFVRGSIHLAEILRKTEDPTHVLFFPEVDPSISRDAAP